MAFSVAVRNSILDHLLKSSSWTAPTALYVSLHSGDPGATGASELSGSGSYARTLATSSFAAASSAAAANDVAIAFTASGGDFSAEATHFGVWDASTSGNFLFGGALSAGKTITDGDTATFAIGDLDVTIS